MKKIYVFIFFCTLAFSGFSQVSDSIQKERIDTTIQAVMQCISVQKGEDVNWRRFKNLFLPTARFNFFALDKENKMVLYNKSLEEFIESAQYGKFEFNEVQLGVEILLFGNIAHAFQAYHFTINKNELSQKGINSIQLVFSENRWWIANISWQPETNELKLPENFSK